MTTRKQPKPPVEYPDALLAAIEAARPLDPAKRAVPLLDALCEDVSLRDFLVPVGTDHDINAWTKEWRAFKSWAAGDMALPMPPVAHLFEGKMRSTGVDFANTPKGRARKGGGGGRRPRDRTATTEQIDAYCDALLAMPEHRQCGWTFAIRLMRYLGAGSDYEAFRERFKLAQERAGTTMKRSSRKHDQEAS